MFHQRTSCKLCYVYWLSFYTIISVLVVTCPSGSFGESKDLRNSRKTSSVNNKVFTCFNRLGNLCIRDYLPSVYSPDLNFL